MATQGSLIRVLDYNAVQTQINKILGNGELGYGYGQSVASSPLIAGSNLIEAIHFANLKFDILKIATHQGTHTDPLIAALPTITQGQLIDNDQITAFENAIPLLETNRYNLGPGQFSEETIAEEIRTSTWGSSSKPAVRHFFTIDFGSADRMRHFFNAGGSINFRAERTGGTSSLQNDNWTTMLSNMQTVKYNYAGCTTSGTGTGSPIGVFQLTSTPQQVFTKAGSSTYSANDYTIMMSTNTSTNTSGTGRYMYVAAYFNDDHSNVYNDLITGTLKHTVSLIRPTGPNVAVAQPSYTPTVLLSA